MFLKKALTISRPIFWIGPPVAYGLGLYINSTPLNFLEILEIILLSFPLSFLIYGINDVYDIETDKINPRKKGIWGEALDEKDVGWVTKTAIFIAVLLLGVGYISLNPLHAIIMTIVVIWPVIYSMPPLRLKSRPILDSIANAGYGYFPFALGCSVSGSLVFLDFRIIAFSLCFSAAHALTTIMDMKEDRKIGIKTFSTSLGPRYAAFFALAIFLLNLTFLPEISTSVSLCVAFAALLAFYVFMHPTPENAKTAFKLMILCFFVWFIYFIINHIILEGSIAIPEASQLDMPRA